MSLFGLRRHAEPGPFSHEARLPGLDGATARLNSPPLTPADVLGRKPFLGVVE
jgi:hypothetical protein